RPGATSHDALYRAPEVDVKQVGIRRFDDGGRHGQAVFVASIELDAHGPLAFEDIQFPAAADRAPDQAFAGYEFRKGEIGPCRPADVPERRIAYVLHGRQQQGSTGQVDLSDGYHSCAKLYAKYGKIPRIGCRRVMVGLLHWLS